MLKFGDTLLDAVWIAEKEFRQFFGRLPVARLTLISVVPLLLLIALSLRVGGLSPQQVPVVLVDLDNSQYSSDLMTTLTANDGLIIMSAANRSDAENMIRNGESSAAIVIPNGFSTSIEHRERVSVELLLDDSNPFLAKHIDDVVSDSLRAFADRVSPQLVTTGTSFMYGTGFGLVNFVAPGVVAMTAMFGTSFQAQSIVWERLLGTLDRIRATPVGASSVVLGKIVAGTLIAISQAIVMLTFAHFLFGAIVRDVGAVVLVVFLVAFTFTGIGIIISSLTKAPRTASAINQMINWPMVLLSGVFYPVQAMPETLRVVAKLLPLTYATDALRSIMIKGLGLATIELLVDVGALSIFAIASLVLGSSLLFKILSR